MPEWASGRRGLGCENRRGAAKEHRGHDGFDYRCCFHMDQPVFIVMFVSLSGYDLLDRSINNRPYEGE
jgi:hypothetical protein